MTLAMGNAKGNTTPLVAWALVLFGVTACQEAPPPQTRVVRPPAPPVLMTPVPLANATAFDLVATSDGALVVWAPRSGTQGSVLAQRLDAYGTKSGNVSVVDARHDTKVVELVASAAGGRLGVAWVESRGDDAPHTFVTFGGARAEAFAPPQDLGPSVAQEANTRGRLVMAAADDGALTLTYRIPRDDCYARDGACERYMHHRLGRDRDAAPGPMDRMEVREACDPLLFGSVWTNGTWYSGICSLEESAIIPVIVVRPEISYAAPNPGARGCTPLGIVALANGAVAVSQCGTQRVFRSIDLEGHTTAQVASRSPSIQCVDGRMRSRASEHDASNIELVLAAPQSRIEQMIPVALAGSSARAVWTGASLLVAQGVGEGLAFSRLVCEGNRLVTNHPS